MVSQLILFSCFDAHSHNGTGSSQQSFRNSGKNSPPKQVQFMMPNLVGQVPDDDLYTADDDLDDDSDFNDNNDFKG